MKKLILYSFIFLFSSTLSGQQVPDNDKAAIDGYINKMMYLDLTPVVSDALLLLLYCAKAGCLDHFKIRSDSTEHTKQNNKLLTPGTGGQFVPA